MAHKTLIDGTAYAVKGGRDLIAGTGYAKKQGKTLIDGTEHAILFDIPMSTITPGAILYMNESGSPVPFYIAKHDYESGLNGAGRTLVVRKDCYNDCAFMGSNSYANSGLDSLLCNTYLKLLDAGTQAAIGTTKFRYTSGGRSYDDGNTTVTTLQRAVFQLSLTELGRTGYYANKEGTALPIASTLQIAYRNGVKVDQWTRTPYRRNTTSMYYLNTEGYAGYSTGSQYKYFGSRPAFTLPGELIVTANPDGTYTLAA